MGIFCSNDSDVNLIPSYSKENSNSSPPVYIGLILDVSKNNLMNLLSLDGENILESLFSDLDAEILTIIKGDEENPYYDFNNLILSSINYIKAIKNAEIFYKGYKKIKNIFQPFKTEDDSKELIEIMKNQSLFRLMNSKFISEKIKLFRNLFSDFSPLLDEIFDNHESKNDSSFPFYLSFKKILEEFDKMEGKNGIKNKYIIIISDGKTEIIKERDKIIDEAHEKDVTIITLLLSKNKNIKKQFYDKISVHSCNTLKNLFQISSKVNYNDPFAHYFIKQGWGFPHCGNGVLLLETNLEDISSFKDLSNGINQRNEYDIKIQELNYNNFIHFKYRFMTKEQILGTCWANAASAAIFLTNKRILGRETESFETIRENLIKYASHENYDGGNIENKEVENFFEKKQIYIKNINEEAAREVIMKGRYVVCNFTLNKEQWDKFVKYFFEVDTKKTILTKDILNKDCKIDIQSKLDGHSVLLIEIDPDYLKFLNSWGPNFGDGGTFKIANSDVLSAFNSNEKLEFFDIYYRGEKLPVKEQNYYNNYIKDISKLLNLINKMDFENIKNYINSLSTLHLRCKNCEKNNKMNKFKAKLDNNGLYKKICPECNHISRANDKILDLFFLYNLTNDGNKDFDINFEEKYSVYIGRIDLYTNNQYYQKYNDNQSNVCSIGVEYSKKKIHHYITKRVNSLICIKSFQNSSFFVASGSGFIYLFRFLRIDSKTIKIDFLSTNQILNDELWTLCSLPFDLFACGGKDLKIFGIDENYKLNLKYCFKDNEDINKILAIDYKIGIIIKRFVVCDKNGYIGIYDMTRNKVNFIELKFSFIKKCHDSYINCILYMNDKNLLVSGSNGDKSLRLWEIKQNSIKYIDSVNTFSTLYNDSLLYMNENLLVGENKGIKVFEIVNKKLKCKYYFENEEFGGVFSMKDLGNNYFICGRSYGFCSVFLLRENSIRKVNIFRNNNLSYIGNYDYNYDNFYITNICVDYNNGLILISSADKTIKIYDFEILNINN